jgi:serine protease Do
MSFDWITKRPMAAGLALVMAGGLGGLAAAAADHVGNANPPASLRFANPDEPPSHNTFAPVVKRVLPAVVNISSSKMVKTQSMNTPEMDPFFRQFFGPDFPGQGQGRGQRQQPSREREQSLGSGVIVSPNGYILTNNHVVDGATDIRVTLADKRDFKAHVVGTDPKTDIALLKIDATDLPSVVIGNSDKLQVGDYVLAIGNPFGLGDTVTMGIVSATGRANLGIEDYEDFIQTDAPINPGNSGGALVNDRGELIGINTAILANGSEGNQGIGFAVPVDVAHNVMDQLLKYGKVERAYLGVMAQEVTPDLAKAFHDKAVTGALVGDVTPDSPAAHAGIQKGDIILDVDGKPVNDSAQLRMNLSLMHPGTTVKLTVLRDGTERAMTATLAELPTQTAKVEKNSNATESSMEGVSVQNLTPEMAQEFKIPANTAGVVVTDVDPNSQAAANGLKPGDVIQQVNHQPVHNTADFQRAVRHSGDETLLLVNRQGTTLFLAV